MNATMMALAEWLLRTSWQAAVLVLLILAVQWGLRRWAGARWRYTLWLLLLVKLAVPYSPASRASVFRLAGLGRPAARATALPAAGAAGEPCLTEDEFLAQAALPGRGAVVPRPAARGPLSTVLAWRRSGAVLRGVAFLWALGALFFAGRLLGQNLAFGRRLRGARAARASGLPEVFADCRRRLGLRRPVRLVETDAVRSPAVHGLFRPTVLLPPGLAAGFSRAELRHVLLHELAHVKRWDLPAHWLAGVLGVVHWFNPFVALGLRRMGAERELACDETVLSRTERAGSRAYGETIIKLLERRVEVVALPGVMGILEDSRQASHRIALIAAFGQRRHSPLAPLLALAALGVFGLTDAPSAAPAVTAADARRAAALVQPAGQMMQATTAAGRDAEPQGGRLLALADQLAAGRPEASPPATNGAPAPAGAAIRFDTNSFEFGRVMSGELVRHPFYFTNVGAEDLVISNVQPQCGCTTTGEWTRRVRPGESGVIPVQFNSTNYNSEVAKVVTVTCNDRARPTVLLQLKGVVWKPIDIRPAYAVLNLRPGVATASVSVSITNALDEPLILFPPESNHPGFAAGLSTNFPGKAYTVTISNATPLLPGNYQGQFSLRTTWTNRAVLTIPLWANVLAPVSVNPAAITLPPGPLATNRTVVLSLINNATNGMTVFDPTLSSTNAELTVREVQPGHYFTVRIDFLPGFVSPPDAQVVFSVKTSNPDAAVIKVPVLQAPRTPPPPSALRRPPAPAGPPRP